MVNLSRLRLLLARASAAAAVVAVADIVASAMKMAVVDEEVVDVVVCRLHLLLSRLI